MSQCLVIVCPMQSDYYLSWLNKTVTVIIWLVINIVGLILLQKHEILILLQKLQKLVLCLICLDYLKTIIAIIQTRHVQKRQYQTCAVKALPIHSKLFNVIASQRIKMCKYVRKKLQDVVTQPVQYFFLSQRSP